MPTLVNPKDGTTLVWVQPGTFVMGSNKEDVLSLWSTYDWDSSWFNVQVGGIDWIGELHAH